MQISKQIFLSIVCLMISNATLGMAISPGGNEGRFRGYIDPVRFNPVEQKLPRGSKPSKGDHKPSKKIAHQKMKNAEIAKPMTVHELKAEIAKIQADNLEVVADLYARSLNHPGQRAVRKPKPGSPEAKAQNEENLQYHLNLLNRLMQAEDSINKELRAQLLYLGSRKMTAE